MSNDLMIIEAFLHRHTRSYEDLLDKIRTTAKNLKRQMGANYIYRIYSRKEKQNDSEIKDASKIFDKLYDQLPLDDGKIKRLHDIVGLTIVVQYPDQPLDVLRVLESDLRRIGVRAVAQAEPKIEGYYATHQTFASNDDFLCEVQVKTVLHDAWASKMHDLTYKPGGNLNSRIPRLVTAVGMTLEGIEQQSISVRNMIWSRHMLETRAFDASCEQFFTESSADIEPLLDLKNRKITKLWKKIDALRKQAETETIGSGRIEKLMEEVAALGDQHVDDVKHAWLLATRAGSGRRLGDLSKFIGIHAERFVRLLRDEPWTNEKKRLTLQIPFTFYVAGDLRKAIHFSDQLIRDLSAPLADPKAASLAQSDLAYVRFNRMSHLLDMELLLPTASESKRSKIEHECRECLSDPKIKTLPNIASALMDAEGLLEIVFGSTREAIRRGIEKCVASVGVAPQTEAMAANACLEWRLEAGWRRYFDVSEITMSVSDAE